MQEKQQGQFQSESLLVDSYMSLEPDNEYFAKRIIIMQMND
jgi:hypothetical protein